MMLLKTNAAKLLFIIIISSSVAIPLFASAYTPPNIWPTGFWGPLVSCTGNYLASNSGAQCTSLCNLINTFVNIVYFAISIALFIIAPISIVVGGIMIMFAGANPGMLENGKKVLTGAVIGVVIVLCSYLIVATFLKIFSVTAIGGFGGAGCTPPSS
jgi:hypothetical protein